MALMLSDEIDIQKELLEVAVNELAMYGKSIFKVGQRGGKSHFSRQLPKCGGYTDVFLPYSSPESLEEPDDPSIVFHYTEISPSVSPNLSRLATLVILEEPFWKEGSYDLFLKCRELNFNTFVIGSNGPEYIRDKRWQFLPGHSFASWDFNPGLNRDFVLEQISKDLNLGIRDYCAF